MDLERPEAKRQRSSSSDDEKNLKRLRERLDTDSAEKPTTSQRVLKVVDIIPLTEMLAQNKTLRAYLKIGGNVNVCDKFLITEDYLKLAKVVFDEEIHHRVLVVGPKGTGKSMSIVNLLVQLSSDEDKPVLYLSTITLKSLSHLSVKDYNEDIIKKHYRYVDSKHVTNEGKEISGNLWSLNEYENFLYRFITQYSKEHRLYLLVDFCELTIFATHPNIFDAMIRFSRLEEVHLTVVIAVSSGEGSNLERPDIYNAFQMLIESTSDQILMNGFTEDEAKVFLDVNNTRKDFKTVESFTGTNPLLLQHVIRDSPNRPYKSSVQTTVEKFVVNNLKLFDKNTPQAIMVLNSLTSCKKYFEYAVGEIPLSEKECDDYAVTWLSKQRVMLLKDSLTLKLNFPTLLPVMYKILACILNNAPNIEEIRKKEDAVNGFLFEAEFFNSFTNNSDFVVTSSSVTDSNASCCKSFTVLFVDKLTPDLTQLQTGILYELRTRHPALDAVGLLNEKGTAKSWLVFIQISLTEYKHHRSKISNILIPPKSKKSMPPEISSSAAKTLYSYYRNLANLSSRDDDKDVIFVYVSPQDTDTVTLSNLKEEIRNKTRNQSIHAGVVSSKSSFYPCILEQKQLKKLKGDVCHDQ